jgi:hypothetical protein
MIKDRSASTGYNLLLLIIGLLLMGWACKMFVPYAILAVPAFIAFVFAWRRNPIGIYGALPIFLFWLVTLILMWMHMLHHDASLVRSLPMIGHYVVHNFSIPAIVLSCIMGLFVVWGFFGSFLEGNGGNPASRLIGFVVFSAAQIAALWISLQPFAGRH